MMMMEESQCASNHVEFQHVEKHDPAYSPIYVPTSPNAQYYLKNNNYKINKSGGGIKNSNGTYFPTIRSRDKN